VTVGAEAFEIGDVVIPAVAILVVNFKEAQKLRLQVAFLTCVSVATENFAPATAPAVAGAFGTKLKLLEGFNAQLPLAASRIPAWAAILRPNNLRFERLATRSTDLCEHSWWVNCY
jgi:hypothetical protein